VAGTCECGNEPSNSMKCGGISWLDENRLASQEGLCPMVELVEEVRTLRERATVLYYVHVSYRVYQYMRINSLPPLRPRGTESLVFRLVTVEYMLLRFLLNAAMV